MTQSTAQASAQTSKTLYTAKVHTIGGRDKGEARSSDGRLDVKLSVPGGPGTGTNPEQLLAAGWSACFEGAIMLEARKEKVRIEHLAIDAEIDLNQGSDGYSLGARLNVSLPDLDRALALKLVNAAHGVCPYSKALKGNIGIVTTLV
jgi:lipoyl-dependent peroxiredoxin